MLSKIDVFNGLRTWVEVDLDNLSRNVNKTKKLLKRGTHLMAVVKADAYGHGAVESSKVFLQNGADWLAVATPSEAIELRNSGLEAPILNLGYTPEGLYAELLALDIRPTIYNIDHAQALSKIALETSKKARIHIKVDTGLSRIGFLPTDESIIEIAKISQLEGIEIEGIFTHFASSDADDKSFTKEQFKRFMSVVGKLEGEGVSVPLKHVSNSSAIMELPEYNLDMVRAGTILYGLDSYKNIGDDKVFLPAMSLKSRISHVKTVEEGTGIGYGSTFTTTTRSKIGTLPIGYADGYKYDISKKGQIVVSGSRVPIVGTIAMDQLMVDLTEVKEVKTGDEAILFGYGRAGLPSIDEVAQWAGTFKHEMTCSFSRRVPRVYFSRGKIVSIVDYLLQY